MKKNKDKINVGVVGYGYWGPNLVRNFGSLARCEISTICDIDPDHLENSKKLAPYATRTRHFKELLSDSSIDLVIIATPVSSHYQLAKEALLSGKDIFIEKPFTSTVSEAEELIEIAEKNGQIIAVDHTFLFTGAVKKIKEIISSGEIGDVLYFDSVRINLGLFQSDINVIYDLAPHDLAILSHLIEVEPIALRAVGMAHADNEIENIAYLHLEYEGKFIAHFHLNWLSPVKARKTIICGSNKMIVYDDLETTEKIKVYDKGINITTQDKKSLYKALIDYRTGDMVAPKLDHGEALTVEANHVIDCIITRNKPIADGVEGLKIVKILEAAQKSIRNHGERVVLN